MDFSLNSLIESNYDYCTIEVLEDTYSQNLGDGIMRNSNHYKILITIADNKESLLSPEEK